MAKGIAWKRHAPQDAQQLPYPQPPNQMSSSNPMPTQVCAGSLGQPRFPKTLWLASAAIDLHLAAIPQGPIRRKVEAAVEIFRDKLRKLPQAVATRAPFADKEAAAAALDAAVVDIIASAQDVVALCERIAGALEHRPTTLCRH